MNSRVHLMIIQTAAQEYSFSQTSEKPSCRIYMCNNKVCQRQQAAHILHTFCTTSTLWVVVRQHPSISDVLGTSYEYIHKQTAPSITLQF